VSHESASLGIAFGYHDSSVAFVGSKNEIWAEHEERFSRIKFDASFPERALDWLNSLRLIDDVQSVYFYEDPDEKRKRIFSQILRNRIDSPRLLFEVLTKALMTNRTNFESYILNYLLTSYERNLSKVHFIAHHLSHASSTFYSSPFTDAAILVMDGVGERASTSIWKGNVNQILPIEQVNFPNSIGLFYAAFSVFCGFKVNSGEYKFMGLAPYGKPVFKEMIKKEYLNYSNDGLYLVQAKKLGLNNFSGFAFSHLEKNFGQTRREPSAPITQFHADLASSVQSCLNELVVGLSRRAILMAGSRNLAVAGGVALNCVANQYVVNELGETNVHFFSASGDAGGSIGAAALGFVQQNALLLKKEPFRMDIKGSKLGRRFSLEFCKDVLNENNIPFSEFPKSDTSKTIASFIARGACVGIFEGRSEFGPRALGNRSIIANPLIDKGQIHINQKIKFRESFRPFAPVVMSEHANRFFEIKTESPFMLRTVPVLGFEKASMRSENYPGTEKEISISDRLESIKSPLPSVTHLDGSARVQTMGPEDSSFIRKVLEEFYAITKCPVLVNTSFNVRGEPIVGTPFEALNCFASTGLDFLYLEGLLIAKDSISKEILSRFTANLNED